MTYTEIKDLLNAGFTKDEIMKLTNSEDTPIFSDTPSAAADTDSTETAEDKSPVAGEEVEAPTSSPKQETDAVEEIKKQLQQIVSDNQELRKMIQTNNIRDRTIDTVAPDVVAEAEKALALLINPDYDGKEAL